MGLHRACCVIVFLFSLLGMIIHATPGVVYTVMYHRSAPMASHAVLAGRLHVIALLAVLISVGCMRRGPLLRATEVSVSSAFGVHKSGGKAPAWWEDDAGQDVLDYGNCSMLTFLTLGYSITLARKSREKQQLTQADLPTLEEWVRTSGSQYLELDALGPGGGDFEPYTTFGLIKILWGGRMGSILISACSVVAVTDPSVRARDDQHRRVLCPGHRSVRAHFVVWPQRRLQLPVPHVLGSLPRPVRRGAHVGVSLVS